MLGHTLLCNLRQDPLTERENGSMTQKRWKLYGIIGCIILALMLGVGSWHQKVTITENKLSLGLKTIGPAVERRHLAIQNLVAHLQKDEPDNQQLQAIANYMDALEKAPFSYDKLLVDSATNQAFVAQEQEVTKLVEDLLTYGASKESLRRNLPYYRQARNTYYVSLQVYNVQNTLNEEVMYFNRQITGVFKGTLNKIFFQYRVRLKLEDMVSKAIEKYQRYTVMPSAKPPKEALKPGR
ncbi:hypothetical protein CC99x_001395 [Candidatus Berkiella cookevillensis]|nr:hypothetical protein [Candidatus Berkiella cookevillensis]MCS5707552.1 hypothetical protein [Candidatus Berkiella cookevillensis]